MKKQLFGGALLAAGLSSAAGAQEFVITGGTPLYTSIIGLPPSGLNWLYIDVNDLYDESLVSDEGSYARSMAGPTVISDIVQNRHKGTGRVAYGIHLFPIKFEVTEQATVAVSWDFSGDIDESPGIYRDSWFALRCDGVLLVRGDLENPIGREEVVIEPGSRCTYVGNAMSIDSGGLSYFRMEILSECPADLDGDGDADAEDFFAYLDAFAEGELLTCDIERDGDCDAEDFFSYLDLFAAGC